MSDKHLAADLKHHVQQSRRLKLSIKEEQRQRCRAEAAESLASELEDRVRLLSGELLVALERIRVASEAFGMIWPDADRCQHEHAKRGLLALHHRHGGEAC